MEKLSELISNNQTFLTEGIRAETRQYFNGNFNENHKHWIDKVAKRISDCLIMVIENNLFGESENSSSDEYWDIIEGVFQINYNHQSEAYSNMGKFINVIKCYRRVYIELIVKNCDDKAEEINNLRIINRLFDDAEIKFCEKWSDFSKSKLIEELRENNNTINEKLRQNEEKYYALVEQASVGIFTSDAEGRYIDVNKTGCDMLGYERSEIIGKSVYDLTMESEWGKIAEASPHILSGKTHVGQWHLRKKDGGYLPTEISTKFLSDGRLQGIVRDISEQKYMEELLKESEVKFRTLAETTSSIIFISDGSRIAYVNPAAKRFTGYNDNEICQMEICDFVHPDFKSTVLNYISNGMKQEVLRYELPVITRDREKKWIDISLGEIEFGNCKGLIGTAFDITDRKRNEEELRESEERYRRLVELLPDAIYIRNDRTILYSNIAGAKLLGAEKPEDVIGKNPSDFYTMHPDSNTILQNVLSQIFQHGFLKNLEQKFIRKSDGRIIDIETALTIFPYEGRVGTLVISRDISDRKKSEELEKSAMESMRLLNEAIEYDKLKTEFFSNISHELRTPINVILGTLQLWEMMFRDKSISNSMDKVRKHAGVMKQNCYRLIRLVNNLIDITKIDSGYFNLNLQNCNIVNIVEDIALSVADYIENKGLSMTFDTDVEEKIIACDPDKIERIILNLLSNSIKFTDSGGRINVDIKDGGDRIVIIVGDTGIGIPDEKQRVIFDRFTQVDRSLSRNTEGSGIGLSLVKSLVEMHGGKISLLSKYGEGSEFTIELPVVLLEEDNDFNLNGKIFEQSNTERIHIEFSDIYS